MTHAADRDWTPHQPARQRARDIVTADERRYRIVVSTPEAPAPAQGYPSILVLDGVQHFAAMSDGASALSRRPQKTGVEPMVVIGVFHGDGQRLDADARSRDYTSVAPPQGELVDTPFGGADAFRRTLSDEVLPLVGDYVPLDPTRRTLFGHSLGGLFVLEALAQQPHLFRRWVSISPSLWWRDDLRLDGGDVLLLGIGERERRRDMVGRTQAFAQMSSARMLIATNADHGSAPFALLPDALRHATAS
nr:alpha/beta hydrolase-fold protein [uncultured Brevundimonas sp.]